MARALGSGHEGGGNGNANKNEQSAVQGGDAGRSSRGSRVPKPVRNRLTALVVDEVGVCRIIEKHILSMFGVQAEAIGSGILAINRVAAGAHYDLILVDKDLLEMNGLEVTRGLREVGFRGKLIGLTAGPFEADRNQMIAAGANDCFEKPVNPENLALVVNEIDERMGP